MPPFDVRMSGFRSRSTVGEALIWLDGVVSQLTSAIETVPLEIATGRVLADDVISPISVPAFDRSAMDGYAVRAAETIGASEYNPLPLRVVGESLPGHPTSAVLEAGTAVRIMTGAPVPPGSNAVVPAEYARETDDVVEITRGIAEFKNIGAAGEDITAGSTVLPRGRQLRPQDVGLLASIGFPAVAVRCRPRVRIIATGEELVTPGKPREPHKIFESNSYMLHGLVVRDGGAVDTPVCRPGDCREQIRNDLIRSGADVILISGGSSVGRDDFAPGLVSELGTLGIHGVAMRPSSPAGLGRIDESLVCLLPGNPVSCLCAYDFFAGRAIRQLGGLDPDWPYPQRTGTLSRKVVSAIGRTDYCRVAVNGPNVRPLAVSGASILSSTTRADGFVIIPAESEGLASGREVTVRMFQSGSVTPADLTQ